MAVPAEANEYPIHVILLAFGHPDPASTCSASAAANCWPAWNCPSPGPPTPPPPCNALGSEAGEWLQQVTLAIRAATPLEVLLDVIQPFPTFSEAVFPALRVLDAKVNPPMPAAVTASTG